MQALSPPCKRSRPACLLSRPLTASRTHPRPHASPHAPRLARPQVEVTVPVEFQGTVMGDLNRRKGMILDSSQQAEDAILQAMVPLAGMFGYSTVLRSNTQVRAAAGLGQPQRARRGAEAHGVGGVSGATGALSMAGRAAWAVPAHVGAPRLSPVVKTLPAPHFAHGREQHGPRPPRPLARPFAAGPV
jgi:hypothetical protein